MPELESRGVLPTFLMPNLHNRISELKGSWDLLEKHFFFKSVPDIPSPILPTMSVRATLLPPPGCCCYCLSFRLLISLVFFFFFAFVYIEGKFIDYKINHLTTWLLSRSVNMFEIHPCCSMSQNVIPVYGWIIPSHSDSLRCILHPAARVRVLKVHIVSCHSPA